MISWAEQGYEATLMKDAESEHLRIPVGSTAPLIERVTFDANDRPFECVKSTYRGDRYRVTTFLHRCLHSIVCFEMPKLA